MAEDKRGLSRVRRAFARAEDRYLLVLIMIVVSLLVTALVGGDPAGRVVVVIVLGGTLIQTLRTSGWKRRSLRVSAVVFLGLLAVSVVVSVFTKAETGSAFLALVGMGLVLTAVTAIVRRLAQQPEITMKTVLGALCIYLYVGVLFSLVYGFVDLVSADPFFAQTDKATSLDFVYFSLVTMTTVGYGDFTSALNVGRMLAVTEALFGQLYMVSVVAILVGNLGSKVPRLRSDDIRLPHQAAALEDDAVAGDDEVDAGS
jgi:hypothetical protein